MGVPIKRIEWTTGYICCKCKEIQETPLHIVTNTVLSLSFSNRLKIKWLEARRVKANVVFRWGLTQLIGFAKTKKL